MKKNHTLRNMILEDKQCVGRGWGGRSGMIVEIQAKGKSAGEGGVACFFFFKTLIISENSPQLLALLQPPPPQIY